MPDITIHLFREGVSYVAENTVRDTVIYTGVRPTGYHSGNSVVVSIYPHLVADACRKLGKKAEFTYVVTLNDIEPSDYDFDKLFPLGSSILHTSEISHIADRIWKDLSPLRDEHPAVNVEIIRASEFVRRQCFKSIFEDIVMVQ
ncbi:MAG: hypothetical protein SWH61_11680 [Thermodesulfobacteriota bacterium]|nr:hypothetical protein [Thermodesulfobacteriota bacterium]